VLGGTQSLHTNSFDEALGLPTERAARLAVRTQQVLAEEADVARIVDPLGGSYAIEWLTDEIERQVTELIDEIEQLGGAAAAIDGGFPQSQIERNAYRIAEEISSGKRTVVGVNAFTTEEVSSYQPLRIDLETEGDQVDRLKRRQDRRDKKAVTMALAAVGAAASGPDNVLFPLKQALAASATIGETCDVLRLEWGTYESTSLL
jgi:methylmalonyl-CoA mutase N-terminal domain/subunit